MMPACCPHLSGSSPGQWEAADFPGGGQENPSPPGRQGDHRMMIFGLRSVTVMGTDWVTVAMPSVTEKVAK